MDNKRSLKISLAAVLAALIATTAFMTGCGENDTATPDEASSKETRVITETQIVTKVVDGYFTDENGEPITDAAGEPVKAVQVGTDANGDPVYQSPAGGDSGSGGSSKTSDSGSNSKTSGSSSNVSGGSESSEAKESSNSGQSSQSSKSGDSGSSQTLTIGNKSYNVGDKVTCTYQLTSKKLLINFQAQINYDSKLLKATNAHFEGQAASGSVLNYNLDGEVKFNGIKLNGYNYTKTADFLVVEYDVIGGGSTAPEFEWQIATDTKDNSLVTNGKPDSSLVISEIYS